MATRILIAEDEESRLPGRGGFEACRAIRGDPRSIATRVPMLTAEGGAVGR